MVVPDPFGLKTELPPLPPFDPLQYPHPAPPPPPTVTDAALPISLELYDLMATPPPLAPPEVVLLLELPEPPPPPTA